MTSEKDETSVGLLLNGRYRLQRYIASGGMGAVYEGVDEKQHRRVAVKLLHSRFAGDDGLLARLQREALLAKNIRSPHVARVLDAGRNRERRGWIVFEYLEGETLDARLRRERRLPHADVAWMILHALIGLEAAHAVGVVHRDIKPANLFLEPEPRLRVLDFGLAKRIYPEAPVSPTAPTSAPLTRVGDMLGTPAYMSPEQLVDSKSIDARTDIYSVGLVVYRMLAGKLLYERQELRELLATKRSRLVPLSELTGAAWPAVLEAWIQKAAAPDLGERFTSTRTALDAWREVNDALKDFPEPIFKTNADDIARLDTDIMPPSMEGA